MNERISANLRRIDELWGIHERRDPNAAAEGRNLAFAVGRRYLEIEDHEGLQFRLGVSFGPNPFTPEMATGFLPPPVLPGRFVFGLHVIASKGRQLTLYDKWTDASAAGECEDPEQALAVARSIVETMPDGEYFACVGESPDEKGLLRISDMDLLEDFEVVPGEAF